MPTPGVWEIDVILIIVVVILAAGQLSAFGGRRRLRSSRATPVATPAARASAAPPPEVAPLTVLEPAVAAVERPLSAAQGEPVAEVENRCPGCDSVNPPGQVFCGQCGIRLTSAA